MLFRYEHAKVLILYALDAINLFLRLPKYFRVKLRLRGARTNTDNRLRVTIFPHSRIRYVKFFDDNSFNQNLNFTEFNSIGLKFLLTNNDFELCVSSDFLNPPNLVQKKFIDKTKITAFIWNDDSELDKVQNEVGKSLIGVESFFTKLSHDFTIVKPGYLSFKPLPVRPKQKKIQHSLLFAGQVIPDYQNELIEKEDLSDALAFAMTLMERDGHPFKLFNENEWDSFSRKLTLHQRAAVRHKVINTWRKCMLLSLAEIFGKRLVLIGNSFIGPTYAKATVHPYRADMEKMYKLTLINLDLGSQCGTEYLYPRTLEILNSNPDSLVLFRRNDVVIEGIGAYWNEISELVQIYEERITLAQI